MNPDPNKGYDVEAVFPDTITGGGDFMKRPGMVELLSNLVFEGFGSCGDLVLV